MDSGFEKMEKMKHIVKEIKLIPIFTGSGFKYDIHVVYADGCEVMHIMEIPPEDVWKCLLTITDDMLEMLIKR